MNAKCYPISPSRHQTYQDDERRLSPPTYTSPSTLTSTKFMKSQNTTRLFHKKRHKPRRYQCKRMSTRNIAIRAASGLAVGARFAVRLEADSKVRNIASHMNHLQRHPTRQKSWDRLNGSKDWRGTNGFSSATCSGAHPKAMKGSVHTPHH